MGGTILLACGGYRSGSTLQYNLAGEYAERANVGRRIGFVEPEQAELLGHVWSFVETMGVAVAKCHLAPATDPRSAVWRRLREDGRLVPVCSVRDWRDVVHSWSRKFGQDLQEVFGHPRWELNLANLDAWLAEGAVVQRYETLMSDPRGALRELLTVARLPLDGDALAGAADAALSRGPNEGRKDVDPRTLVHSDHVANPGGGGWRHWSPSQRRFVEPRIAPLMARFGYDWGDDW